MASDVLEALRRATSPHHQRLDSGLGLPEALAAPDRRRRIVGRFYGWQAGVERALGESLDGVTGLDLETRRRARRFAPDLAALDIDRASLPLCPVPSAQSLGEALGLLYVAEGSTLGGKVIGKALQSGGHDLEGLGFLDPYGTRTGEMWRGFLGVLEREARSERVRAEAVRGAVMGFQQAERWLNPTEVAA